MVDTRILTTFFAAVMAIVIASIAQNGDVKENFTGMPARSWRVMPFKKNVETGCEEAVQSNFFSKPSFQANISPRFMNVDFGANIRYNLPRTEHMAADSRSPLTPLSKSCSDCYSQKFAGNPCPRHLPALKGKSPLVEGFCANSSQCGVQDKGIYSTRQLMNNCDTGLPVSIRGSDFENPASTEQLFRSASCDQEAAQDAGNVVIFDRLMFTNKRSRLHGRGDPIRGDLPIAPCNTGSKWFVPSADPQNDLRTGALAVMGGIHNSTPGRTARLVNQYSAGTDFIAGGTVYDPEDYASCEYDASVSKKTYLQNSGSDVIVSAFV